MYSGISSPVPVPKPDSGSIRIYKSGYVYYISETIWDPVSQHSKDNRTTIGKLTDQDNTMMFPNKTYFYLFGASSREKAADVQPVTSRISSQIEFGSSAALLEAANQIGCIDALKAAFPDSYQSILSLALYTILSGEMTAQKFEYWYFHNYCPVEAPLTSGEISRFYKDLLKDSRSLPTFINEFKDRYFKAVPSSKIRVVGLDSTNQNTTSSNKLTAYGHAKKKKNIPIINTAMFVDEETGIPIYYEHFTGSIMDKSETPYTLENLSMLGFQKFFAMMDRGYFSKDTVESFQKNEFEFGMMVPDNALLVDEMISSYGAVIKNSEQYWIEEEAVYGIHESERYISNLGGKYDVYLFYDDSRAAQERTAIHQKIQFMEGEIDKRKRYSEKLAKKYDSWFEIVKTGHNEQTKRNFTVTRKYEAIQEQLDEAGLFVVVSNAGLSADEMIKIARSRDKSEKAFRRIKTDYDMETPHTHYLETYEAKMFISYVALIIEESFRWYEKSYLNKTSSITTATVLGELSKYEIRRDASGGWSPVMPATRKEKEIWKQLGLSEKDVKDKISKLSSSV